jgi:uncharacterized protein (DUF1499 family)
MARARAVASSGRRRALRWLAAPLAGVLLVLLAAVVAIRAGHIGGQPPVELGVRDGRLHPPSATPNSVHSQADLFAGHPQLAYARIAPLVLSGDGPATIARLQALIEAIPGARIVDSRPEYLRAEFRSRWIGFIDDAEFWFDPAAQVVQMRSASRLGARDFGVNRARIEALRAQLATG